MSSPGNFRRFLSYVAPYKHLVALAAIGGIVKFTVPLLVPQVTRHLIDNVFLDSGRSAEQKVSELFLLVGGLIGLFLLVWAPWTYVRHYFATKAGQRSVADLRCALHDKVLKMSAGFFNRHQSGGIVSRLMNDISLAQDLVGNALTNVWMDTAALVVIMVFLLRIDVSMTLVALACFPLYLFFFRKLGKLLKESSKQVQQEIESMSGRLQEKVAGSAIVRSFNQEEAENRHFTGQTESLFNRQQRTSFLNSMNQVVTGVLTSSAPLIVMLYGGWQVIHGSLSIGGLIAVTMYLGPLYLPLQRFSELNVVFSNAMAALDRIFEIMDEQPEIRDRPGAVELRDFRGVVEFDHVAFAYQPGHPVLRDVSFRAEAGQRIALVGHSGSGKSTIISLVPRFYDALAGAIRLDGQDVRDLTVASVRAQVAMVLQDPILFSGTIRDNILYGQPQASESQLLEACRQANALDFIMALSEGFDTEVGERGAFLSGGQKQRLTIARAFLRDPRILILDEATSALDADSERLIKDSLDRLMASRTTLIIAHRLSTIVNAHRILVLHQGLISESGTHAELMERGGIYQGLYAKQHGGDGQ